MNYYVALGDSISELITSVEEAGKEGFRCQGGLSVIQSIWTDERKGYEKVSTVYYQAMVKDASSDNKGR